MSNSSPLGYFLLVYFGVVVLVIVVVVVVFIVVFVSAVTEALPIVSEPLPAASETHSCPCAFYRGTKCKPNSKCFQSENLIRPFYF